MSDSDRPHAGTQHETEAQRAPEPQRVDATPPSVSMLGQVAANIGAAAVQRKLARRAIQRREAAAAAAGDGAESSSSIHEAARLGTSGPGQQLPHVEAIQRSFGKHDISHIEAHVGSVAAQGAAAMGAEAFATGNQVAFGDTLSLHTAAHEAAHVVQQRSGVHLKGGVGAAGDAYEQHADAVADGVVRGSSVESLLDAYATPATTPATDGPVQRKGRKKERMKELLTPDPNAEGIGLTALKWAGKGLAKGARATGRAIASAARGAAEGISDLFEGDEDHEDIGDIGPHVPDQAELNFMKVIQMKAGVPEGAVDRYKATANRQMALRQYAPFKQMYVDAGMTEEDLMWIFIYTDNASYAVNAVARGLIKDQAWVDGYGPMIEPISQALTKIPAGVRNKEFQGQEATTDARKLDPDRAEDDLIPVTKLYRADSLDIHFAPAFLRDYAVGAVLNEPGFLSTMAFKGSYGGGQMTQTVSREIDAPADIGRAVAALSKSAHENEVLLPRGTQMRVKSIHEVGDKGGPVPKPTKIYKNPDSVIGRTFDVQTEIVTLPPEQPKGKKPKKSSSKDGDALGERLAKAPKQIG